MKGFVYVMSNEAMPGIYKIGCTSKRPEERAAKLSNTSVPTNFIIEYCIYIEDFQKIEHKAHQSLANFKYGKEFFKCDLIWAITQLKRTAIDYYSYKEKYRNDHLRAIVEGREHEYLKRQKEEKLAREKADREQQAELRRQEELRQREWEERQRQREEEKNRLEQQRKESELKERQGCGTVFIWLAVANIVAGLILPHPSDMLFYGFFISLGIGLYLKR